MSQLEQLQHLLNQALQYHQRGELDQAKRYYLKVLDDAPGHAFTWHNLANLYTQLAAWSDAEDAYQQALNRDPDYLDAHYNFALCLLKQDKVERAKLALEQIIMQQPDYHLAHYQLANYYFQQQLYAKAQVYYENLIELQQSDPLLSFNYATCLLQQGQLDLAKQHYVASLQNNEHDVDSLYNLGVIHLQQQSHPQAQTYFKQVLAYEPQHFAALINMGVSLIKEQQHAAAIPYYQQALNLQPHNPSIQYTLTALQGIDMPTRAPVEYIQTTFDKYADYYDQHLVKDLGYCLPSILQTALKNLSPSTTYKALDLGCGTGLCGNVLKNFYNHLTGVDLSNAMLKKADATQYYNSLHQADIIEFLESHTETYDLILIAEVLIYFGDLTSLFSTLKNHLKNNGYIIFTTEVAEHHDYQLNTTGRYAHNINYIKRLINENNFKLKHHQEITCRQQEGFDVKNNLFTLTDSRA